MELRIDNDKFYVLELGKEKRIFDSEEAAVASLKEALAEDEKLNPEGVNILEVDTSEEQWKIQGVPWSRIAISLIRGE
ncbi:MAG: hypothetical protein ACE5KR_03300 [Candidatus Bipolaricaulia bacterium]